MGDNEMKAIADALWAYFQEKYLIPYLSDSVCYFQATVTTAPSAGVIGVQRPFDNTINLPYAWSASTLSVGDQCTVLMFGDMSNAVVIGDGTLSQPGSVPNPYDLAPYMDWVASPGVSDEYARGDHVHPTDTSRAPTDHASSASTYGTGSGTEYGHVQLSDSHVSTAGESMGIAATPAAVKDAYDLADSKQDAITGTAGQYVGFDSDGNPQAQSPDATPTAFSSALITSGAVYGALQNKPNMYVYKFTSSDWTAGTGTYNISVAATTHECGTDPCVEVFKLATWGYYERFYGYPSEGWTMRTYSNGNITISAAAPFDGKLVIR